MSGVMLVAATVVEGSEMAIENAALRVGGRTGALESNTPAWQFLSSNAKRKGSTLPPNEQLIIQDNFMDPMLCLFHSLSEL